MEESIGAGGMEAAWEERVRDKRPRVKTGWPALDDDLHRGGFAPGELTILGGRTRTRKTTTTVNMMANMMRNGVKVGFVALDETVSGYTSKLASAISGVPMQRLEEEWDTEEGKRARRSAFDLMKNQFSMFPRKRPTFDTLSAWVDVACPIDIGDRPQVVFVDYISLLARDKYAGADVQRISRLVEDLQVWTSASDIAVIALHQVGRMDEGNSSRRYHGDSPMTLESLKFGGEEIADIVLGTYRPELNPLGKFETAEEARWSYGDKYDEDEYLDARNRVQKYEGITFLQLLKNRPGVHTNERGVLLKSGNESLHMAPLANEGQDDGKVVNLHG